MVEKTDFDGPESGYIIVTWNTESNRWQYRPVMAGVLLSDSDIAALGLDAPLANTGLHAPKIFGQRNNLWGGINLKPSSYTMANAGCAVTSFAMAGTAIKPDLTPLDLVNYLNVNGGFTSAGELYWYKAAQFIEGLTFVKYHLWRDSAADITLLKSAMLNGPQIIQVDFRPATSALNSHFVLALSFTEDDTDINIIDPWTGQAGQLLKMYGKPGWTLGRAVYALAQLSYV